MFTYIENNTEREYLLRLSMVEVYNEHVRDLLTNNPKPIRIMESKVIKQPERKNRNRRNDGEHMHKH